MKSCTSQETSINILVLVTSFRHATYVQKSVYAFYLWTSLWASSESVYFRGSGHGKKKRNCLWVFSQVLFWVVSQCVCDGKGKWQVLSHQLCCFEYYFGYSFYYFDFLCVWCSGWRAVCSGSLGIHILFRSYQLYWALWTPEKEKWERWIRESDNPT